MTTLDRTYCLPPLSRSFVVSNGVFSASPKLLRDAVQQDEHFDFQAYFDNGYRTFMDRLAVFEDTSRTITPSEEKELMFMLEALIAAKNSLEPISKPHFDLVE
jgi:hypothetical protein